MLSQLLDDRLLHNAVPPREGLSHGCHELLRTHSLCLPTSNESSAAAAAGEPLKHEKPTCGRRLLYPIVRPTTRPQPLLRIFSLLRLAPHPSRNPSRKSVA